MKLYSVLEHQMKLFAQLIIIMKLCITMLQQRLIIVSLFSNSELTINIKRGNDLAKKDKLELRQLAGDKLIKLSLTIFPSCVEVEK